MITEYIDPERRGLAGLLPLRIRNKEVQVDEFKLPVMQPFTKKDPFDSVAFIKRVKAAKGTAKAKEAVPEVAPEPSPSPDPVSPADEKLIADPIVEDSIRKHLAKPKGELTEEDLKGLTKLSLTLTKTTDEGLKEVLKLQNLESLGLSHTKITDKGLSEVAKMPQVKYLDLPSQTTDAGLKEVVKLQSLETLWLFDAQTTDAGLKDVAKLQKLSSLNLTQLTQVTAAGVAELKKALPKCEIISDHD